MIRRALFTLAALSALTAAGPLRGQTFVNPTLTAPDQPVTIPLSTAANEPLPPRAEFPGGWQPMAAPVTPADSARAAQAEAAIRYNLAVATKVSEWEEHAAWADANREEFAIAMERWRTNPGRSAQLAGRGDSAFHAVQLAAQASNPVDAREARTNVPSAEAAKILAAQRDLSNLYEGATIRSRGWPILIFATGTASEAIGDAKDTSDDGKSPLTTGSLGASVLTDRARWTARVSIISANATAPADFGPLILTPGSGQSLASAVLDWRAVNRVRTTRSDNTNRGKSSTPIDLTRLRPNHVYLSASSLNLEADTGIARQTARATVLGAGALSAREIFNGPLVESTNAALSIEGGVALRWMSGDATQNSAFGPIFLDRRALAFGPEFGFSFSFGRITTQAQVYHLWNHGDDIPGLNGLQMVAGMSVTGEFLSARLPARGP